MHEQSLVRSLLRQVESIRAENGGLAVDDIRVEIGPLAGVEPLLLESAFAVVATEFDMPHTRLIIDEIPLTARCPLCGTVPVEQVRILCPTCGSPDVTITGGDAMRLISVTLQTPQKTEPVE